MSKFKIKKLDRKLEKDYNKWIKLLQRANGDTIFHHPEFLSYHNDNFNEHHLGVFKGEQIFGMIPLAINETDCKRVAKSPYGASFGGFIFENVLTYMESKEVLNLFIDYLKELEVSETIVTPSLSIYHNKIYSDTFSFAMMEKGFNLINSDITSVVPLKTANIEKNIFTSKTRNMIRKAEKSNIKIEFRGGVDDFWSLMDKTFSKHGVNPTHTKKQYIDLMNKLSDKIYCNIAYIDDRPAAAMGVFEINEKNIMSFYLCKDINYQQTQALSLVISETIKDAQKRDFNYFDFGTSSVNMEGKENIFRFKEGFGAIGQFKKTYKLGI